MMETVLQDAISSGSVISQTSIILSQQKPSPAPDNNQAQCMMTLLPVWIATSVLSTATVLVLMSGWLLFSHTSVSKIAGPSTKMVTSPLLLLLGSTAAVLCCCLLCIPWKHIWPLILAITTLAIVLLLVAAVLARQYRISVTLQGRKLQQGALRLEIHKSMGAALLLYDKNPWRWSWDEVQERLECCGAEGPEDWIKKRGILPKSCCEYLNIWNMCTKPYTTGCVDAVGLSVAYSASLVCGLGVILIIILTWAVTLFIALWIRGRRLQDV